MTSRIAALVVGMCVLAGCGGGGSPVAEATKPPAPKSYTAKQLDTAMPRLTGVPGAKKVSSRCPGQDKVCPEPDEGRMWAVMFELNRPVSGLAAEKAEQDAWFDDVVLIDVWQHESATASAAAVAGSRKSAKEYDGDFDTQPKTLKKGRYTPGDKGTGSVDGIAVEDWSGFRMDRKGVSIAPDGDVSEEFEVGQVMVAKGPVTVSALVSVGSADRPRGEAGKLARRLIREYFVRLG